MEGAPAWEAFEKWQSSADLDRLSPGLYELLPLVYDKLADYGMDHPWKSRLKGVYRRSWYANQLSFNALKDVINGLDGVTPILVTGAAALARLVYKRPGLRPIPVPEIVVPEETVVSVTDHLREIGWRPCPPAPQINDVTYRICVSGHRFTDSKGRVILLSWHMLPEIPCVQVDKDFRERAVKLNIGDTAALTLDHTDHLLCACLDGRTPIRLADAALLIRGGGIDWSRVKKTAGRPPFAPMVSQFLNLLAFNLDIAAPLDVSKTLGRSSSPFYERLSHKAMAVPPEQRSWVQRLGLHYARYRRILDLRPVAAGRMSFFVYLQQRYNLRRTRGDCRTFGAECYKTFSWQEVMTLLAEDWVTVALDGGSDMSNS